MKHLIIYAHPNGQSLNNSILELVQKVYTENGHEVVVRNLYDLQFNPVLSTEDMKSFRNGSIADDIQKEQQYISWADTMTFIYPIWWTGLPAILKGYIDRVFSFGFAYSFNEKGLIKLLTDKKALIFNTHGLPKSLYDPHVYNALNITSNSGIFDFCGIEVLSHTYYAGATSVDQSTREGYLAEIKAIAEKFSK
jgi:NAD(P)H dehydrogenase (quinone)